MAALLLVSVAWAGASFGGWDHYIGDLHAHSGASKDAGSSDIGLCEGDCGALADMPALARAQGLDFLAVVDHVNGGPAASEADYAAVIDQLLRAHDPGPGGLVTLPGAELFFRDEADGDLIGHKTLLLFASNSRLSTFTRSDAQPRGDTREEVLDCGAISIFMERLSQRFGLALLLPHHPAAGKPMPTDWDCWDRRWSPAVEIYSEHGNSLGGDDIDPLWGGSVEGSSVMDALDPAGPALQLGFVGGSDNHDSYPGQACRLDTVRTDQPYGAGLTVALLPAGTYFGREALYEAIAARRTIASTGPLLPLAVTYAQADGRQAGIGEELLVAGDQALGVEVSLPPDELPLVREVLLRGPEMSWSLPSDGAGTFSLELPGEGLPAYLFVEVVVDGALYWAGDCPDGGDDDLEHLWTSPTWFYRDAVGSLALSATGHEEAAPSPPLPAAPGPVEETLAVAPVGATLVPAEAPPPACQGGAAGLLPLLALWPRRRRAPRTP